MINRFLKAKHWQLFVLTFGIPIFYQIFTSISMATQFTENGPPDVAVMINYFQYLPIIAVLYSAMLFGWYWSVAIGLQKFLPENTVLKIKKFKIFFFIPLVYILLIIVAVFGLFAINLEFNASDPDIAVFGLIAMIFIPLHLFSMFCIFYTIYFVAKTIKTVELQREVSFSDFVGEFFLIWFYPIGIWILQPKINRLVEIKEGF